MPSITETAHLASEQRHERLFDREHYFLVGTLNAPKMPRHWVWIRKEDCPSEEFGPKLLNTSIRNRAPTVLRIYSELTIRVF
jgi:hypothetical protein